jgi:hypothetical protein
MIHAIIDFFNWPAIVLAWALFFTFTAFEYVIRDATAHDDTMTDHILIEKFAACVLWGLLYYLTH